MNEQQASQTPAGERVVYERCLCRETLDQVLSVFGVSPTVQHHLRNSRIEILKAVRAVINERIERLSSTGQQGTKVAVE
jgi:hypothetical protein